MRLCIFGAGAVGSHFAVRLALAGHDVSCVMRGPHLKAVKAKGLTLRVGDAEFSARVNASDDPAALGPQDFVISTLKATGLSSLATGLQPLLRDDTAVVFAQNGIPWWYDLGLPADHPPPPNLSFLDPGGLLRAAIPKERIIGGVIFSSNEIVAPGMVANLSPDRNMLLVGECDDRASGRIERLRTALDDAAIGSPSVSRIRETIWSKLMTNMSMSVLCLLTGQTCYPSVKRAARAGAAPEHKPSLLQDFELGRAMEIDALVRAPAAFAWAAGLSTPMLDVIAALVIQKARDKGLYQAVYQSQPSS
jgi:2-dehydropantoate 2-reductase